MVLGLKEEVDTSSSLTQKQSPGDNHLQMKIVFSPRESHWSNEVLLSSCMPSSRWATEMNSTQSLPVPCLIMSCQGFFMSLVLSLSFSLSYFIAFLFLLFFNPTGPLCIYCHFCFYGIPVSVSTSISCVFSFCLFVLFYSDVFVFSYFIITL